MVKTWIYYKYERTKVWGLETVVCESDNSLVMTSLNPRFNSPTMFSAGTSTLSNLSVAQPSHSLANK